LPLPLSSDFGYAALGVVGIFVYQVFFVALPRLRDAGMSVWWVLLGLIPFLYLFLTIILLFRPPEFHFGDVSNDRTVNA
jgi:uncharacterized membrane protein YhaH (DUF805 family)